MSPQRCRWRLLKHVIVAALRFQTAPASGSSRFSARWMQPAISYFPDLELKSIIETGESPGKVYRLVHRRTGQIYAVKEYPYDSSQRRRVQILKELDHPNVVKCYDVVFSGAGTGANFLLLEPLERGSPSVATESDLVSLARQLILGVTYLHQNGISHGDIKPSNVFVNPDGQVKLLYSGKTGAAIGASRHEFELDVRSVGQCVSRFAKGLKRPPNMNLDMIFNEDIQPRSTALELMCFILDCASGKMSAEQLVHHPFFNQPEEVQLPQSRKEKYLCHEKEELMSCARKRPKIYMEEDMDRAYDHITPEDPIRATSLAVPERCIEYCKLFLPDREFDKNKLVRMWIAEGCIELGLTERIEDVGNLYFDALFQNEVIVYSRYGLYKLNTSRVPDGQGGDHLTIDACASYTSEIYRDVFRVRWKCERFDQIFTDAMENFKGLHLSWMCDRLDETFRDAVMNFKGLHTLVVYGHAVKGSLPGYIFGVLTQLRTLDLSYTFIEEVPYSIGDAKSLRYLDFSETPIRDLPESLHGLYYLQTLNLQGCTKISNLPDGLGKLLDLRHLDVKILQLRCMPKGIGNLVKLQTLPGFVVGLNFDGWGNINGCGIGELKNMNEITGSFVISRLENVSNAVEAKEAALWDKKYIDKLVLRWDCYADGGIFKDTDEIFESLQPHFGLKDLRVIGYGGFKLPRWMSNPCYTDLSSMTLMECVNCDTLPAIGKLPSLKVLIIYNMANLRNINTICRNLESEMCNAFLRLEKLKLENLPSLEEWSGVHDGDFPCLGTMSIVDCPKLRVLPSINSLRDLDIRHCTQLIGLPEGLSGSLESLNIRCCPGINEKYLKNKNMAWSKIRDVRIDLEKMRLR